ncbi:DUF4134 family protein [Emticicia sp. SJ17W-69]|uniref:DUF4134 family protein n=1 Tax=Emticicia sp. SJ17W-69 TaxID=3421657 RepID=UPI003EBF77D3
MKHLQKKHLQVFAPALFPMLVTIQPRGIEAGASALDDLTAGLQDYIDPVTTVIYIIAIILGLVGAFRVYVSWQQGKDNVMQSAAGWFGSCLFLLIANTVLRAMFI